MTSIEPAEPMGSEPSSTERRRGKRFFSRLADGIPLDEPPMTPEEEEQAPEDWRCMHKNGCRRLLEDVCRHGCRDAADELTRLDQEMESSPPCTCSSRMETDDGEVIHAEDCDALKKPWPCGDCGAMVPAGEGWCIAPDCREKAEAALAAKTPEDGSCACGELEAPGTVHRTDGPCHMEEPPAPQPDKRPPYAVAYSVQGHLFEVALSGDATIRAVDGALVITHHLGPIAGIVHVVPIVNEESD